jgi:histidinol dehydrogenase
MMRTVDLRGTRLSRSELEGIVPRATYDIAAAAEAAGALIADVRERGEPALLEQAERFDGVRPAALRVPATDIAAAVQALDPAVRSALDEMIARVRSASAAQLPQPRSTTMGDGGQVDQRWVPVARAGLYVPGGKAVYPSSVVMSVVPAQVAGVASVALVSPPQREFGGGVHPTILAAAGLLGVDEVYAVGGAGAIGALAYGVPGIGLEPVQVITGPGNVFVAAAKRLVRGQVGIDSEAGPTEILVIADESATPAYVAADLVSQAEHDELAAAVLVTDSEAFAESVAAEVVRMASATAHAERVAVSLAGAQSGIVLVDDLGAAAAVSNAYGPEHLSIQTADPDAVLTCIDNAGAVFLGGHAPVSLGDYLAGSNHVLPTGGQSRFSSGLGAHTFLRPQQVIRYSRPALAEVADRIVAIANAEDLPAHGEAVAERFRSA